MALRIQENSDVETLTKHQFMDMKKKNEFEEHGCEFKNEDECEEELEEEGVDYEDTEKEFFEED